MSATRSAARPLTSLALASAIFASGALAQDRSPTAPLSPAGLTPSSPPHTELPVISLRFEGGTLREFVDVLNAISGKDSINVGFRNHADQAIMPAIALKGVSVATAMQSMRELADPGPSQYVSVTQVIEGFGAPLYTIDVRNRAELQPQITSDILSTRVFSLKDVLRAQGTPDASLVLSVLEAALEVDSGPSTAPPTLRFHKESSILIVRGNVGQLQVVESVLATMRDDAKNFNQPDLNAIQAIAKAEADVSLAKATCSQRQRELEALHNTYSKKEQLHDSGAASDSELANTRDQMIKASYEFERSQIQLQLAEQMLDAIKKLGNARLPTSTPAAPSTPHGDANPDPKATNAAPKQPGK